MQERRQNLILFSFFLLLSIIVLLASQLSFFNGFRIIGNLFFPLDTIVFSLFSHASQKQHSPKILQQNKAITAAQTFVNDNALQADNTALQDQFNTTQTRSLSLLPSHIIGMPSFIPGVSIPQNLVIDQGSSSNVQVGDAVIYKNNLLGTVVQVMPTASLVLLISSTNTSFTAKTSQTHAVGVLRGQGNGLMILDNVVLSDQLKLGDIVVTSYDQTLQGKGYPQGLVIGKVLSIQKNPSNLFQDASVQSLVDVTTITMVFVVKGVK